MTLRFNEEQTRIFRNLLAKAALDDPRLDVKVTYRGPWTIVHAPNAREPRFKLARVLIRAAESDGFAVTDEERDDVEQLAELGMLTHACVSPGDAVKFVRWHVTGEGSGR